MTAALRLMWKPPGAVANAFYWNRARMALIQGPVGAAKTSTCFLKAIRIGTEQAPSTLHTTEDGRPLRKVKCCTVHMTYRQLWRATIKTWWKWMPQNAGHWEGGKDGPASHQIPIDLPDGSRLDFIHEFMAIGDYVVEEILRGYEPTFFILNEADLLPRDVFKHVSGRWGRYPPADEGGPTWHGAFGDLNAPVIGSYLHEQITEGENRYFDYFRQPGGMEPGAENLHNLPDRYYEDQIAQAKMEGESDIYIDRMVHNKFGQRRDGKPIFPEFNDALHVAPNGLEPIRGLPILIGFDAGGTPAASFWQRLGNDQWRGLDEVVTAKGETMGVSKFARAVNRKLKERFEGFTFKAWGDPAAFFGGDDEDASWMFDLARKTGLGIRPAPGNNRLNERFEAERKTLERMIDGREPGLLIDPRMKYYRRGMGGAYRFRKLKTSEEKYAEEPDKNEVSHVCESSQYVKLGAGEYQEVKDRQAQRRDGRRQTRAIDEDNPRGRFADGGRQRRAAG